jgi:hypothetical protein
MTPVSQLTAFLRPSSVIAWAGSCIVRLPIRGRGLPVVDPERWPKYLLRDIGLAE